MSLPTDWVDAIFARLTVAYGDRFLAQWPGQQPDIVKAHWAAVLTGITSGGISYALQHLPPDYPPNAMQFDRLCRGRPSAAEGPRKALAGPPVDPQLVRRTLQAASRIGKHSREPRLWARELQQREEAGERLNPAQATMWRAALLPRMTNASIDAGSSPEAMPDPVNPPAELAYPEPPP